MNGFKIAGRKYQTAPMANRRAVSAPTIVQKWLFESGIGSKGGRAGVGTGAEDVPSGGFRSGEVCFSDPGRLAELFMVSGFAFAAPRSES